MPETAVPQIVQPARFALKVSAIYALVGALWIFFSDKLAAMISTNSEVLTRIAMAKGWLYVLLTAVLLFKLISRGVANLERSRAQFKAIFNAISDAVIFADTGHRIRMVNPAFGAMFGYDAATVRGRTPAFLYTDSEACPEPGGKLDPTADPNPVPAVHERACRRRDGTVFPAEFLGVPVADVRGQVIGRLGIHRDISARKGAQAEREKLHAQLIQAQKMEAVGRLAGGVAHDFNNMLGVILGHAELALDQTVPNDPRHLDLMQIQEAARRSADLTRQLLAFARQQTVCPKVVDLNDTVAGMLKMLRRLIGEDIDLTWQPGHGLWPVKIDPSQVDQVLANLTVNARDAIAGVGKVTIETANVVVDDAYCAGQAEFVPGDYVLLAVSDTGAGMTKEVLQHVFEPFFTTKQVGKGTGLGLATVYGITRQNNGFITVYSEPGQGTTFRIYLPRFAESIAEVVVPPQPQLPHGTETVLLVEDEKAVLQLTMTILQRLGYTVRTAATPAEAIELVMAHDAAIHLLITDVVMPEMNGRELSQRLTALKPGLKCLFMSGYTADAIAHHGVLDEGVVFIQKPFSRQELATQVRKALEQV